MVTLTNLDSYKSAPEGPDMWRFAGVYDKIKDMERLSHILQEAMKDYDSSLARGILWNARLIMFQACLGGNAAKKSWHC